MSRLIRYGERLDLGVLGHVQIVAEGSPPGSFVFGMGLADRVSVFLAVNSLGISFDLRFVSVDPTPPRYDLVNMFT